MFLNHYSFALLVVFIWVVALAALRQRGWPKQSWMVMAGLSVVLVAAFLGLRPAAATGEAAAEIRSQIGQGTPVLLEFQSQY